LIFRKGHEHAEITPRRDSSFDAAVRVRQSMEDFLKQAPDRKVTLQETLLRMSDLARQV